MQRTKAVDEAQVRAVIDEWASALRDKDVARVISHYVGDFVQFALAPPLLYRGANRLDKRGLEEWFSSFQGPIGYEIRDLRITAGDDVAFSHSLNRMTISSTDGEKTDMWFRQTLCFRKIGGEWKIAHEHESVPFYMDGSARAATDLKP